MVHVFPLTEVAQLVSEVAGPLSGEAEERLSSLAARLRKRHEDGDRSEAFEFFRERRVDDTTVVANEFHSCGVLFANINK